MTKFRDVLIAKYSRLGTLGRLRIVYHNALYSRLWEEHDACHVEGIALPEWVPHRAVLVTFKLKCHTPSIGPATPGVDINI